MITNVDKFTSSYLTFDLWFDLISQSINISDDYGFFYNKFFFLKKEYKLHIFFNNWRLINTNKHNSIVHVAFKIDFYALKKWNVWTKNVNLKLINAVSLIFVEDQFSWWSFVYSRNIKNNSFSWFFCLNKTR